MRLDQTSSRCLVRVPHPPLTHNNQSEGRTREFFSLYGSMKINDLVHNLCRTSNSASEAKIPKLLPLGETRNAEDGQQPAPESPESYLSLVLGSKDWTNGDCFLKC